MGYYIPANGSTWAAYWSPTDPTGQIVYTADAYRGVDVLHIDGGGLTVKAPVRNEWFDTPTSDAASFQSHPTFGFMCPVLRPEVDLPQYRLAIQKLSQTRRGRLACDGFLHEGCVRGVAATEGRAGEVTKRATPPNS